MAGHARVLGEQARFPDLGRDAAEAVDELGCGGDAALVGRGVDACDRRGDDGVVGGQFLEGGQLGDERTGSIGVFEGGPHGFDGEEEVLGLEVRVDDFVPG